MSTAIVTPESTHRWAAPHWLEPEGHDRDPARYCRPMAGLGMSTPVRTDQLTRLVEDGARLASSEMDRGSAGYRTLRARHSRQIERVGGEIGEITITDWLLSPIAGPATTRAAECGIEAVQVAAGRYPGPHVINGIRKFCNLVGGSARHRRPPAIGGQNQQRMAAQCGWSATVFKIRPSCLSVRLTAAR